MCDFRTHIAEKHQFFYIFFLDSSFQLLKSIKAAPKSPIIEGIMALSQIQAEFKATDWPIY